MQVRPEGPTVRPPAVAGLFYPLDPARLRAEVSELLAEVALAPVCGRPKVNRPGFAGGWRV